jgi:hypothetical protein
MRICGPNLLKVWYNKGNLKIRQKIKNEELRMKEIPCSSFLILNSSFQDTPGERLMNSATTPMQPAAAAALRQAQEAAGCLIRRGVPTKFKNDLIAVIFQAINQATSEARQNERQTITAEWLTQVLPGEVITMAAEKVAGKAY